MQAEVLQSEKCDKMVSQFSPISQVSCSALQGKENSEPCSPSHEGKEKILLALTVIFMRNNFNSKWNSSVCSWSRVGDQCRSGRNSCH